MTKNLIRLIAIVIICMIGAILTVPQTVWTIVAGPADLGSVDFAKLEPPASPNAYLACPVATCPVYPPGMQAPVFDLAANDLMQRAKAAWMDEANLQLVDESAATLSLRYVQRTAVLGFPDTISVRFVPVAGGGSTVAIYSRSQIGYSDFGANQARVERWLARLAPAEN